MMFLFKCNIDKTDRVNRIVIGLFIILSVVFNMTKLSLLLLGGILILEGVIGWCSIPFIIKKIKSLI